MANQNNSKRRREELMLKRSDRALARNRCWDELNAIYATCVGMLYQHKAMAELNNDRDLLNYLTDHKTLVANIQSLSQDLLTMNVELQKLHAQHLECHGAAKDADDLMRSLDIAEQYNLFMERHNGVVLPTVWHILEQFQQAELTRQAAQGKTASLDAVTAAAQSTSDTGPIDIAYREEPLQTVGNTAPTLP